MSDVDVVVVGGGLAGLACARELVLHDTSILVIEASDDVGGRVRTDLHEGFRLDRGFQVLLEAYPECRAILDYDALDLRPFYPGAMVRTARGFTRITDPFRRPSAALRTLLAPVGTLRDKLGIARLRSRVLSGSLDSLFEGSDRTTLAELRESGFTPAMIDGFFRSFFGGILLDASLDSSAHMFRFVYRMLALGRTSVPAFGMQRIPAQIADSLPAGSVRTGARAVSVTARSVTLESGETIEAGAVVVATEGPECARLVSGLPAPASVGVTCLYFAAPEPPVDDAILVLAGKPDGQVNNVAVMSNVSPAYAPDGEALVSVTVLGIPSQDERSLVEAVTSELAGWFGAGPEHWRHLRTYRIPHAQPAQPPGSLRPLRRPCLTPGGVFVCGDHRETASLNGAVGSGRRAARELLDRG